MRIAILGCGPSGLLAAHACKRAGFTPDILSRKVKSPIFAAMFLHASIPGICPEEPSMNIEIVKNGCREGYAENVYGDPSAPVSWDKFSEGKFPAWDLRAAYDKLWDMYSGLICNIDLRPETFDPLLRSYDFVISTIPRVALCHGEHYFTSQRIWVLHGAIPAGLHRAGHDDDLMQYNGYTPDGRYGEVGPEWYRFSQIGEYRAWEYSRRSAPVEYEAQGFRVSEGFKPTRTNCDCRPGFMKVGRFGAWQKQVLTHHVYEEVSHALQQM